MQALLQTKHAKLFVYQIPFRCPLNFNGQRLTVRNGLILQLQNNQGHSSFGEIAPLPGFSVETLQQAQEQILALLNSGIGNRPLSDNLYPSVRFAVESALRYAPFAKQLGNEHVIPLLQGDNQSVIKHYQALAMPTIIKLKVGRQRVQQDIALFNQLTSLNSLLIIRCDANQAWHSKQASHFFANINTQQLDYIEEPTASFTDNLLLAKQYQIGLALDETLHSSSFHYQHHPQIKALILKPSLIGSLTRLEHYINIAQQQTLAVSISSSFESIVGLLQLNVLADSYKSRCAISLGLDTVKYFQSGLLTDPRHIEQDLQTLECLWNK
jgi:O-succinylbenzoate synthase